MSPESKKVEFKTSPKSNAPFPGVEGRMYPGFNPTPLGQQRALGWLPARELGFNPKEYSPQPPEGEHVATLVMKIWGNESLHCYFQLDDGLKVCTITYKSKGEYVTADGLVDISNSLIGGYGTVIFATKGKRHFLHHWDGPERER